MKALIRPITLAVLVSFSGVAYAQDPGQPQPPAQKQEPKQEAGQEVSITGCLMKGTESGQFLISSKEGQKIEFSGSSELDQYSNQTVTLTGRMVEQGGKSSFQPRSVRRVSPSCQAE